MENKQRTDISTIGEFGLIHRLTENMLLLYLRVLQRGDRLRAGAGR